MTLQATARDVDRSDPTRRAWVAQAIRAVQADATLKRHRSKDAGLADLLNLFNQQLSQLNQLNILNLQLNQLNLLHLTT